MTLYVIGNGFDLFHGFKTNYKAFKLYLDDNYPELLELMSEFYYIDDDSILWFEFEKGLATFDESELVDLIGENMPNYGSDDFRDGDYGDAEWAVNQKLEPLKRDLQEAFNDWIHSLDLPANYNGNKIKFDDASVFLTFNYTDVLERIYGINRKTITYIHNRVNEDRDLIFGHSWNPNDYSDGRNPKMPDGLTPEEQQHWMEAQNDTHEFSSDIAFEAIDSFFATIYKNADEVIKSNPGFFRNIRGVDKIHIYGHSLSEVDIKYFEKILSIVGPETEWTISYYSASDEARIDNFQRHLQIPPHKLNKIRLNDLLIQYQGSLF